MGFSFWVGVENIQNSRKNIQSNREHPKQHKKTSKAAENIQNSRKNFQSSSELPRAAPGFINSGVWEKEAKWEEFQGGNWEWFEVGMDPVPAGGIASVPKIRQNPKSWAEREKSQTSDRQRGKNPKL